MDVNYFILNNLFPIFKYSLLIILLYSEHIMHLIPFQNFSLIDASVD